MGTMAIDTVLTYFVVRGRWRYPLWVAMPATAAFLSIDLTFFSAALHKVPEGGWFPLLLATALLAAVLARALILALIDALSFPAANHVYALPAMPLSPPGM